MERSKRSRGSQMLPIGLGLASYRAVLTHEFLQRLVRDPLQLAEIRVLLKVRVSERLATQRLTHAFLFDDLGDFPEPTPSCFSESRITSSYTFDHRKHTDVDNVRTTLSLVVLL